MSWLNQGYTIAAILHWSWESIEIFHWRDCYKLRGCRSIHGSSGWGYVRQKSGISSQLVHVLLTFTPGQNNLKWTWQGERDSKWQLLTCFMSACVTSPSGNRAESSSPHRSESLIFGVSMIAWPTELVMASSSSFMLGVYILFTKCGWFWIRRHQLEQQQRAMSQYKMQIMMSGLGFQDQIELEKQCKKCTASYACMQMHVKPSQCHIRTMSQHVSISTHWGLVQEMSQHCFHCWEPLLSELIRLGI